MARGIDLVFLEKRQAHVYRKISAWHDYSFTTFHYCLSSVNAHFLLTDFGGGYIRYFSPASGKNNRFNGFFLTVSTGRSFCARLVANPRIVPREGLQCTGKT
jgi:hypothetical protein